jgi:hypothetical protein
MRRKKKKLVINSEWVYLEVQLYQVAKHVEPAGLAACIISNKKRW